MRIIEIAKTQIAIATSVMVAIVKKTTVRFSLYIIPENLSVTPFEKTSILDRSSAAKKQITY